MCDISLSFYSLGGRFTVDKNVKTSMKLLKAPKFI